MSTTKGRPLKRPRFQSPSEPLTLQSLPCTIRTFLNSTTENLIVNERLLNRLSIVSSNGNQRIIKSLDSFIFPDNEQLLLDGIAISRVSTVVIIIAWYKPKNMTIDASNGQPFHAVLESIEKKNNVKLHPIGQLDKNTTGLFLFTNCGNTGNFINLPGNIQKVYEVTYIAGANREPTTQQIELLTETGIDVSRPSNKDKKDIVKCHSVKLLSVSKYGTPYPNTPQKFEYKVELSIASGANHIVKRVIAASKLPPVKELKRIRIGNISLEETGIDEREDKELINEKIYCLNDAERNELCSDKQLIHLKLCQLLCKYRTLKIQNEKHDIEEVQRLGNFLELNFRICGPCYDRNSQLKCRGGVTHNFNQ